MPFGLSNVPATFQATKSNFLTLLKFVIILFDDILVYSSTMESHLYHLAIVLNVCPKNHFF